MVPDLQAQTETAQLNSAYKKLLELNHRPTITEVKEAFGDLTNSSHWSSIPDRDVLTSAVKRFIDRKKKNGADHDPDDPGAAQANNKTSFKVRYFSKGIKASQPESSEVEVLSNLVADLQALSDLNEVGPELIVHLEKAFPGARIFAIGRDSAFLADLFDTYYQSIGVPDKVVRVELGRNSFKYPELVKKYLDSIGLPLDSLSDSPMTLFLDATHFNPDSQSQTLLRIVRQMCLETPQCDPDLLLKRVGFINTGANIEMYSKNLFNGDVQALRSVLTRIVDSGWFNEALSLNVPPNYIYTLEYHNSYEGLQETPEGKIKVLRGMPEEDAIQRLIIRSQVQLIRTIETPLFKSRVQHLASEYGLPDFSGKLIPEQTRIDRLRRLRFPLNLRQHFNEEVDTFLTDAASTRNETSRKIAITDFLDRLFQNKINEKHVSSIIRKIISNISDSILLQTLLRELSMRSENSSGLYTAAVVDFVKSSPNLTRLNVLLTYSQLTLQDKAELLGIIISNPDCKPLGNPFKILASVEAQLKNETEGNVRVAFYSRILESLPIEDVINYRTEMHQLYLDNPDFRKAWKMTSRFKAIEVPNMCRILLRKIGAVSR